jgi:hypothetical protein
MPPSQCPVCGAEVPPTAKACPECGACDKSGWSQEAHHENLDLPEENFDYDEFIKDEFEGEPIHVGKKKLWWITAVVLLGILIYLFLGGFW